MDAAHIFRQGLGTVPPRPNQVFAQPRRAPQARDDLSEGESSSHRVAHTLTACCRCRQRKTRCDPTLPRCLPCERSGSVCEYLDTARGRKINRRYVITLQDKVRALEAELGQYTDEDGDHPPTIEDMVRPGGMVRLNGNDETPRYLGPTSGIAMTRLLMAEAKRFTDTTKISDLIPEVRARSQARMQSIQMTGSGTLRKKSYPMVSAQPAEVLPGRPVVDKLVGLYFRKSMLLWPVLHEQTFQADLEAVFNGDTDPHKNFFVNMVVAVGLQKLDTQYAGLADGYYLSAMKIVEDIIRPKDLKALQCLVLIAQYSLLTPTRTPIYYVIGLAAKICQQEGLTDEKTLTAGYNLDPLTIDLRRRLVWIIATMELGLSYYMGRPSFFATSNERLDVGFFSTLRDEHISVQGIQSGTESTRKIVAIHFYKMRESQAEITRTLYEKKRLEPRNDLHPWFESMEKRIKEWLDLAPEEPPWSKPFFENHYHELRALLYRPSPQLPQPSPRAAQICYDSSAAVINISRRQMELAIIDITWIFLLTLNVSLSTLLWTTSYPEVRQAHTREEVEELVNIALECLDRCAERWPGTASTSQLCTIFSKACLQSYDAKPGHELQPAFNFASPQGLNEAQSSPESYAQSNQSTTPQSLPYLNPPQFGYVFDSPPESMNAFTFDPNFPPPQPAFRSNSIFCNPATDYSSRRFSYFPPDVPNLGDPLGGDLSHTLPPPIPNHLPTPPDSINQASLQNNSPGGTLSPPAMAAKQQSNLGPGQVGMQKTMSPPQKSTIGVQASQGPSYIAARMAQPPPQQRPLPPAPTTMSDWFTPPPQFVSPYNFVSTSNGYVNNAMTNMNGFGNTPTSGLGLQHITTGLDAGSPQFGFLPGRQGSLSSSQQLELINVLETEGMGDMDAFLNANQMNGRWY